MIFFQLFPRMYFLESNQRIKDPTIIIITIVVAIVIIIIFDPWRKTVALWGDSIFDIIYKVSIHKEIKKSKSLFILTEWIYYSFIRPHPFLPPWTFLDPLSIWNISGLTQPQDKDYFFLFYYHFKNILHF